MSRPGYVADDFAVIIAMQPEWGLASFLKTLLDRGELCFDLADYVRQVIGGAVYPAGAKSETVKKVKRLIADFPQVIDKPIQMREALSWVSHAEQQPTSHHRHEVPQAEPEVDPDTKYSKYVQELALLQASRVTKNRSHF